MPQTRLTVGHATKGLQLRVYESIVGATGSPFIRLRSDDGKWDLKLPRAEFAGMLTAENDIMIVTVALTRVVLEEEPDLPGLGNHKIITPSREH